MSLSASPASIADPPQIASDSALSGPLMATHMRLTISFLMSSPLRPHPDAPTSTNAATHIVTNGDHDHLHAHVAISNTRSPLMSRVVYDHVSGDRLRSSMAFDAHHQPIAHPCDRGKDARRDSRVGLPRTYDVTHSLNDVILHLCTIRTSMAPLCVIANDPFHVHIVPMTADTHHVGSQQAMTFHIEQCYSITWYFIICLIWYCLNAV